MAMPTRLWGLVGVENTPYGRLLIGKWQSGLLTRNDAGVSILIAECGNFSVVYSVCLARTSQLDNLHSDVSV